ncbi:MAG TPA: DUF3592 domain-containing protein [Gemmataceae bacterium]|nr:DUF3592 domain-containing protein [Gemmataceae bacterium]
MQLPPPPRVVGRRRGRRGFLRHIPLTLLLLCVAGLGLLLLAFWFLTFSILVTLFGMTVPGEVTGKSPVPEQGRREGRIEFNYYVKGVEYSSEDGVDQGPFEGLQVGSRVKVRVLSGWPNRPLLVEPVGHTGRHGGLYLWFAILGNIALWVVARRYLREPLRQRALVRTGVATEGVIVCKEVVGEKRPVWTVQYCYRAPCHGVSLAEEGRAVAEKEWQVMMLVRPKDFQAAQVGATMTILYDPQRPSRSLIYSFAEYEAKSAPIGERPA